MKESLCRLQFFLFCSLLALRIEATDYCIIGGGVAGLAAARNLIENGAAGDTVEIFEASNRLGGRIYNSAWAQQTATDAAADAAADAQAAAAAAPAAVVGAAAAGVAAAAAAAAVAALAAAAAADAAAVPPPSLFDPEVVSYKIFAKDIETGKTNRGPDTTRGFDFGGQWMHGYLCNPLTDELMMWYGVRDAPPPAAAGAGAAPAAPAAQPLASAVILSPAAGAAFPTNIGVTTQRANNYVPTGGGSAAEGFRVRVYSEFIDGFIPGYAWQQSAEAMDAILEDVQNEALQSDVAEELSLEKAITEHSIYKDTDEHGRAQFNLHMNLMFNTDVTSAGDDISSRNTDKYVMPHEHGDAELKFKRGLASIAYGLSKWNINANAAAGRQYSTTLNTRVTKMDCNGVVANKCILYNTANAPLASGGGVGVLPAAAAAAAAAAAPAPALQCDKVIVTVPLGVLKRAPDDGGIAIVTNGADIIPASKKKAFRDLGFGTLDKLFLQWYETPDGWPNNVDEYSYGYIAKGGDSYFPNIINALPVYGVPVLVFLTGGSIANVLEEQGIEALVAHAMPIAGRILNIKDLPYPDAAFMTRWHRNQNSYGAYTYVKPKTWDNWAGFAAIQDQRQLARAGGVAGMKLLPVRPPPAANPALPAGGGKVAAAAAALAAATAAVTAENVVRAGLGLPPLPVAATAALVAADGLVQAATDNMANAQDQLEATAAQYLASTFNPFVEYRDPIINRVFFAGEGTSEKRYGYVDGAYISGLDAAAAARGAVAGTCDEELPADYDACDCPTGEIWVANEYVGAGKPKVQACLPNRYVAQARDHHQQCINAPFGYGAKAWGAAAPGPAGRLRNRLSFTEVKHNQRQAHHASVPYSQPHPSHQPIATSTDVTSSPQSLLDQNHSRRHHHRLHGMRKIRSAARHRAGTKSNTDT